MHDQREIDRALALVGEGLNDCEIFRVTGIPRRTILDWRHGRVPKREWPSSGICFVCTGQESELPAAEYAFLLGLYLGDGCISRDRRTYRLRLALDANYPAIVDAAAATLEAIRPEKRAWKGQRPKSRCIDVSMCWNHWPCVIPQHGPGRKHLRRIALERWQVKIIQGQREPFIRGLFHSDGCRIVANDRGVASVRYHFSNRSEDIKGLLCDSLDEMGIHWTRPCSQQIAIYRQADVRILDTFVGPKR